MNQDINRQMKLKILKENEKTQEKTVQADLVYLPKLLKNVMLNAKDTKGEISLT